MKTQKEKEEVLSYDEAISSLKIYIELTKQVMPALKHTDAQTVSKYNKYIQEKIERLGK